MKKYHNILAALYFVASLFLFIPIEGTSVSLASDLDKSVAVPIVIGFAVLICIHLKLFAATPKANEKKLIRLSWIGIITFVGSVATISSCMKGLGGLTCALVSLGILLVSVIAVASAIITGLVCIFKKSQTLN